MFVNVRNPIDSRIVNAAKEVNLDQTYIPINILSKYFKGGIIQPLVRIYLLNDEDETVYCDVSEDIITWDFSKTYQSGQRANLNVTMHNEGHKWTPRFVNGIVHIGSKFRLDIGFLYHNVVYWKQMGIFLLKDPSMSRESSNKTISFSLCDKFGMFDGSFAGKTGLKDIIPAGVKMYEAFVTICTADRGNGQAFDLKPILFNSRYKHIHTYYTIKQDAGNMLSTLMVDMANTISSDVYYNEYGNLCVQSNVNEFLNGNQPVVWRFDEGENDLIAISQNETTSKVVNSVIVKGAIANAYQFSGFAKNRNLKSEQCIQHRGELFEYIRDDKLYSDELCQDRAMYELVKLSRGVLTVNITAPFLPIWDVNKAVIINQPEMDIHNEQYIIDSLAISSSGTSLTLTNVEEVNFGARL